MKALCLLFVVNVLVAIVNSVELPHCTDTQVNPLVDMSLADGVLKLTSKNQYVSLEMKKVGEECYVKVTAYKEMQMELDFKAYALGWNPPNCTRAYFKAGNSNPPTEFVICEPVEKPVVVKSTNKILYMALKSTSTQGFFNSIFNSLQGEECGPSEIVLTTPYETVSFPKNGLPFTKNSECDFIVYGYHNRSFNMFIKEINLYDGQCSNNYLTAKTDPDQAVPESDKKCKMSDISGPISAPKGILYLQIMTLTPKPLASVTLQFETDFPECGSPQVTIPKDGMEITLPPEGETFKDNTFCIITFNGTAGMDFILTIPEIKFPDGSCNNDYVSASTDRSKLPNITYQICGSTPVTNPFKSVGGAMYLQIKTSAVMADAKVKLKFQPDYFDCESFQLTIPRNGMELVLPPKGKTFKPGTSCIITFYGTGGMDFRLTIPEIKFPAGNCNNDYVSASTNRTQLPNVKYQICGTTPITSPFNSAGGAMYVQIKTSSVIADSMVRLKFRTASGLGKRLQYSYAVVILISLLSIGIY